ncbi:MAG: DUF5320 domain-containing protein [Gaiellaceae bacterium]
MPNKDKTGPKGEGPLTGGGRGPCQDETGQTAAPRGFRLGRGMGFGRGAGLGGAFRGRGRGRFGGGGQS